MSFRLKPDDDDFNLLDFNNDLVVGAEDGLKRSLFVVAPPGQKYDLEFGPTTTFQTKLGYLTLFSDGGFKYEPDQLKWDNARERIDSIQYWVKICGRATRTTGRFAIKQGVSEQNNNLISATVARRAEYLLDGGAYDADMVANWLHEHGRAESPSRLVILGASKVSDEAAFEDFQKRGMPRWGNVHSFVVNTTVAANDPRVSDAIEDATAIFINGGDQGKYWLLWNDTQLQASLNKRVGEIPIGGTSAGMAILGGEIYVPPMNEDGVRSAEAMSNPLDVLPRSRFSGQPFLKIPYLDGIYLETHFTARKRLGRMSAILAMSNTANRAIMADEATSLSIDDKGIGTVMGKGRIYFAELTTRKPKPRTNSPLTTGDIKVVALKENNQFDLSNWSQALEGVATTFKVDRGVLSPSPLARREWYDDYGEAAIVADPTSGN